MFRRHIFSQRNLPEIKPPSTGESTSISSDTGANWIVFRPPEVVVWVVVSAVPYFQLAGSVSDGLHRYIGGLRSLRDTAPPHSNSPRADWQRSKRPNYRRSPEPSPENQPAHPVPSLPPARQCGRHTCPHRRAPTGPACPFAENFRPAKSTTGPVGPCSPGIHSGYTSVIVRG